jgi:hypothetical protein
MLLIFFIILVLSANGVAAPVGNIGDPMLWNPGPFQQEGGLSLTSTLTFENQTNQLVGQMTRFSWTKPDVLPLEKRHYSQTRSSKNTLNTLGLKLGFPIKDKAVIYGVVGNSDSTINFHYEDTTVVRSADGIQSFSRNFKKDNTFESGSDIFFGLGASFIIQRGEYEKIPLTLGMDISYRRYSIEQDKVASEGLSYSSTLDEIQLAFCLSAETKLFSPYLGVKVASITGTEDYINNKYLSSYYNEGYIHYNQDITWSKNIGYLMGVTTSIKGLLTVGIEVRGGDENAIGINATTRF